MVSRVYALLGPTAAGKSRLAMGLARLRGDVEVVAIDAFTIYRGMDIGTAKPTAEERAEVPHHCIDLREPWEPITVAEFQAAARAAIADVQERGRVPVLVGGSGLYYELFGDGGFNEGDEAEAAYHLLDALPLAPALAVAASVLLILVVTIFFVTSSDSGSLVVDTLTNGGDTRPVRLQRAFWAVSEGGVTLILLVLGGASALGALQAASVVTGLPFAVILVFMLWGLFKALSGEPKPGGPKKLRSEDDRPPPVPSGTIRVDRKGEGGTPEEAEGT